MISKNSNLSSRKKEFYKIVVARSDISSALAACDLFLSKVKDMSSHLYFPLSNAIIICYSRPFSSNKPFGPLSEKWREFHNERFQKTHETILSLTNKTIAHSDLEIRKVFIYPPGTTIAKTGIKSHHLGVAILNDALPIERFPEIRATCFDLGCRLNTEIERELRSLFGNRNLPSREFELTFDDKEQILF